MLFSIVVPVYRVEPYLERCITCLMQQSYRDIEIILVDDESPDHCPRICDDYAACDSRIKVLHKKNGGLSDARNCGLRAAAGEYVLFVDSDDYIDQDTCQRFSCYADGKADILIGDAVVEGGTCSLEHIPADGIPYTGPEYLKKALQARRAPMAAWLNVYRRAFLDENDLWFKYGILHEDEQFTPRAFLKANAVVNTGVTFYHYILRDGSITARKDKRRNDRDLHETCCELERLYHGIEDSELRTLLLDTLAVKTLNMFQTGRLYQYGRDYIHKDFVMRNAASGRTRAKAALYCLSPRLYYFVNRVSKKQKR